jgi:uncharacterized Zn finger protein
MPVIVTSTSDPNKQYVVHVNPWGDAKDNICECKGFQYRGNCRHQEEALDEVCGWSETAGKEVQAPYQREAMICPRCDGTTKWSMVVDE